MDTVIEKNHKHQNKGSQRNKDVLHPTSNEVSCPQNSPSPNSKPQVLPPCINCQSFLLHHSPNKLAGNGFAYADEPVQNQSKPPLPPRTYQSSGYKNTQRYAQLEHTDTHIYLDVLPSNDNKVTPPPVPPRPPPRLPLHPPSHRKTKKRTSQPALACVVSLRGGGPPIRHTSSCENGKSSRPISMPNPSGKCRRISKDCFLLKYSTQSSFKREKNKLSIFNYALFQKNWPRFCQESSRINV